MKEEHRQRMLAQIEAIRNLTYWRNPKTGVEYFDEEARAARRDWLKRPPFKTAPEDQIHLDIDYSGQ